MRTQVAARAATMTWTALAVALLGACGADEPSPEAERSGPTSTAQTASVPGAVQELDIVGDEYTFRIDPRESGPLQPGWTGISFRNEGREAHQVMFARVKDGVDPAELAAVAGDDSSGAAAIEYVDMLGGVSYIGPGQTTEALVDLPEGMVLAMCYVPTADGTAHALLGMTTVLTVGGTQGGAGTGAGTTDPPRATTASGAPVAGTIELAADGYRIPETLPTGWYHVVNTDTDPEGSGEGLHELSILRLASPASDDDVRGLMQDLATNAPTAVRVDALGGFGAVSAGFEGYLYLDLPPGDYVAVDFMPDPRNSRPHLLDGYYTAFSP